MWNQKLFDIVAGMGVFVAVTLLLGDVYPDLAYAILLAAFGYMLLSHVDNVSGMLTNFRSAIGKQ